MSKLISDQSLERFKTFRKNLLKIAMWIFVGGVATGVLLILFGGTDSAEVMGKIMGTLFLLALAFGVSSNLVGKLEEDNATAQGFAILGIFASLAAIIMWILFTWGVFPEYAKSNCIGIFDYCSSSEYHIMYKISLFITYLASLGFFAANTIAIKEYDRGSAMKPLKITAVIALVYTEIYSAITVFNNNTVFSTQDDFSTRLNLLAAFASGIWLIATIVALIISHGAKKQLTRNNITSERDLLEKVHKQLDEMQNAKAPEVKASESKKDELPDDEEEMRKEIEKRVRAELMEKEIREKVEAEMKAKKSAEK